MCVAQQLCPPLASSTGKAASELGSQVTGSKEPLLANYAPPSALWVDAVLGAGGNGAGAWAVPAHNRPQVQLAPRAMGAWGLSALLAWLLPPRHLRRQQSCWQPREPQRCQLCLPSWLYPSQISLVLSLMIHPQTIRIAEIDWTQKPPHLHVQQS